MRISPEGLPPLSWILVLYEYALKFIIVNVSPIII